MTFWEVFFRLLFRKPVPAFVALYWHATRRRVRARNRLLAASADQPFAYAAWIDRAEKNSELTLGLRKAIEGWSWRPQFSILLHASSPYSSKQLKDSITSIERQIYPFGRIIDAKVGAFDRGIAAADGDYLVPLRVGDVLSDAALFRFAEAVQLHKNAAVLFGDQDERDDQGRRSRPWLKPRWNPEMFLAQDYLSQAVAIETAHAKSVSKSAENLSELVIRACFESSRDVVHVPHILSHVAARTHDSDERLTAVSRHLRHLGATCGPGPFGTIKVKWPLPEDLPLVSIVVPTRDKLELLRPCVESVLRLTDYENFEVMIVDNSSVEQQTADYLVEISNHRRVQVIAYPGPYNFSAMNNFAVLHTRGSYVCLLNNDTEVVEPAWLTEMMRYAVRPNVGAVGAKLLYEDGTIQHAGVVIGIGEAAGHAHRFLPANEPGYFLLPHVSHFVSAVTAACLVVDKSKFCAVGGLDELELPVAFNDVDLCLKIEAAGWRNVYVPHAVLLHHESKSRGADISPHNIDRYRRELEVLQGRWRTKTYVDPLHHPSLDRHSETFVIRI